MKRTICLVTTLVNWVLASAQSVQFEAHYYTFEEIAQRMSVGEHKVVCDPNLKLRMALMSVAPRQWDTMRSLLEQSLDLKFVRQTDGTWRLTRNPEVSRREQILREKLAVLLETRLWEQVRKAFPSQLLLESISVPVLLQETQSLSNIVSDFRQHLSVVASISGADTPSTLSDEVMLDALRSYTLPPISDALKKWANEIVSLPQWQEIVGFRGKLDGHDTETKVKLTLLTLGLTLKYFRLQVLELELFQRLEKGKLYEAMMNGYFLQWIPINFINRDTLNWLLAEQDRQTHSELLFRTSLPVCLVEYRWMLEQGSVGFSYSCLVAVDNFYIPVSVKYITIDTKEGELTRLFSELDSEYYKKYMESTRQHHNLVQDDLMRRNLVHKKYPLHFYRLLLKWSQETNQEVIAEIYLQRADVFYETQSSFASAAARLRDSGAWRVEKIEDVWVWRNWLAFVDRVPDFALGALNQLVHSQHSPDDWRRFVRQVQPTQARWFSLLKPRYNIEHLFEMEAYLGSIYFVGSQWLLFRLLEGFPNWNVCIKARSECDYGLGQLSPSFVKAWLKESLQLSNTVFAEESVPLLLRLSQEENLTQWLLSEGYLKIERNRDGVHITLFSGNRPLVTCPARVMLSK